MLHYDPRGHCVRTVIPRDVRSALQRAALSLLQATALELGAVPVGAFDDDEVVAVLGLPKAVRPVYLVAVGWPR